jgi:large subunit ribosomal protein L31
VKTVKKDIHPAYSDAEIKCACGKIFKTKSTRQNLTVEVCSNCHPFYTGKQRFIGIDGRVEKFKKRLSAAQAKG